MPDQEKQAQEVKLKLLITNDNVESNHASSAIIIKFSSWLEKSNFIIQYFKFKLLNLQHIGFSASKRIIVSDRRSQVSFNHRIFKAALKLKVSGKISKIHVSNGLVHVNTGSSN